MPRPHQPRKRPRRRPPANQRAARADAALTKQTAESTQPKTPAGRPTSAAKAEVVAASAPAEAMWSRRSYAILMATVATVQVVIGVLLFLLVAPHKDPEELFAVVIGFQPLQPVPQLAACLIAAPVARRISGEQRPLRIVETLMVGVIIYALFFILLIASQFVLTAAAPGTATSTSCGPNGAVVTPLPVNATPTATPEPGAPTATPCPSPSASPAASPSARPGASPSPSPSASASNAATAGTSLPASAVLATFGIMDILAYVLAIYIYPPVYQRLRYKPPPPRDRPAGTGRAK
jgi:hypothetical protein